nr:hypothetical protein CFP56_11647 [Quercus suber]
MEEVQGLQKKLKIRQERLAEINSWKDIDKENLLKRIKTLQSRLASDAEVQRSERLSYQFERLQDNINNLKSKNYNLTAKNIKLRSSAPSKPWGTNTPSVTRDLVPSINNDTAAMRTKQREELEDAKKMIARLEQQLKISAAAEKSSSEALAQVENVAVVAQAALHSQNSEFMQLEADNLQFADDQTRALQRIEDLEKHISELIEGYDRSIDIIQATHQLLTTELSETHAQLIDSMNHVARLRRERGDSKNAESQAASSAKSIDTILMSEANQRSVDQLTELVDSYEGAAAKTTERIAHFKLEITTVKAASLELKQTKRDLQSKLQQIQLQPETLADYSKELKSE